MTHPTIQLIQQVRSEGLRPFEVWSRVIATLHERAREMRDGSAHSALATGRLVRSVATEMGVQTKGLTQAQMDDVFHGAQSPSRDRGKLLEKQSRQQFDVNLKDWKHRFTREERQRIFTPKKWRKDFTPEKPKGVISEELVDSLLKEEK